MFTRILVGCGLTLLQNGLEIKMFAIFIQKKRANWNSLNVQQALLNEIILSQ